MATPHPALAAEFTVEELAVSLPKAEEHLV
jgi:hypothetical protein